MTPSGLQGKNKDLVALQTAIEDQLSISPSQNNLAKKLGISAATLINVRQGKWDLLSDEMINKLQAKMKIDKWPLKATWNFNVIQHLCEDARMNHKFYAIAGYTGAGKTTALRFFSSKYRNVYLVHGTAITNKRTFLSEIQQAMGISKGQNIPAMMEAIIEKIHSIDYPLLIIDDAGKLTVSVMQLIQIIYDATEGCAGIILSGTDYLSEMMSRMVRVNKMGFQELYRRIAYWQPLHVPEAKMVEAMCMECGITSPECIGWIQENAHNYGDIRNYIENAVKASTEKDIDITRSLLEGLHVGKNHYNHYNLNFKSRKRSA